MKYNPEELLNSVEIIDPPIQELKKRGRWFATACFSGCGCILLFVIAAIVGIKLFIGPGPKTVKNLPENFPSDIPIFDQYNIDKITYVSGEYKSRTSRLSALIPGSLLSPTVGLNNGEQAVENHAIKNFWHVVTSPLVSEGDLIQIEWYAIDSTPTAMIDYYLKKLEQSGFSVKSEELDEKSVQIIFEKQNYIQGTVYVESDPDSKKIPYAFLKINLAPEKTSTTTLEIMPIENKKQINDSL